MPAERTGPGPVPPAGASLRKAADALGRLVKEHLALARIDLREDVRRAGPDVAAVLAGVSVALLGWALLMVALAVAVAALTGPAVAFALVGLVNLGAGAVVARVFARRLVRDDRPGLDETTLVLEEDRRWLQTLTRSRTLADAGPYSHAPIPPP